MTTADHANTIREAMHWLPHAYLADCTAALDALQAQAETAEEAKFALRTAEAAMLRDQQDRRAAEDERDRLEAEVTRWQDGYDVAAMRANRAEAERDRLAEENERLRGCVDLLRPEDAAQFWHNWRTHPALAHTEQP